jgi:hypothetical protein
VTPTAADIRRWLAGFDAAAIADRDAAARRGPQPEESIRQALSLIAAVRGAHGGMFPIDPLRERDAERVRAIC